MFSGGKERVHSGKKWVKSRHFSKRIGARRQFFHFLYKILGIIS